MSKLIEQEGKFYKECGVVMLDTNDTTSIIKWKSSNQLNYDPNPFFFSKEQIPQHLYITSDGCKAGDWYLGKDNKPHKAISSGLASLCNAMKLSKIIATTDTSLGITDLRVSPVPNFIDLPSPSNKFIQAYIEAYNQGKPIEKVLVEYEQTKLYIEPYKMQQYISQPKELQFPFSINIEDTYTPKLKDNNIIIKKCKDSWSREEVIALIQKYETDNLYFGRDSYYKDINIPEEWIKENL